MTDEELIARLRKADEYEPLGHDGWEAADRIEALVKARREDALELLAAHGQAQDAYEAQLKAEAQNAALTARVGRLTGAADYILDGMGINAPDYLIDPDDDFLDAANSEWVRDALTRLAAALSAMEASHE